jgi:hypothetical protein
MEDITKVNLSWMLMTSVFILQSYNMLTRSFSGVHLLLDGTSLTQMAHMDHEVMGVLV